MHNVVMKMALKHSGFADLSTHAQMHQCLQGERSLRKIIGSKCSNLKLQTCCFLTGAPHHFHGLGIRLIDLRRVGHRRALRSVVLRPVEDTALGIQEDAHGSVLGGLNHIGQQARKATSGAATVKLYARGEVGIRATWVGTNRADGDFLGFQLLEKGIGKDRVGQLGLEVAPEVRASHDLH